MILRLIFASLTIQCSLAIEGLERRGPSLPGSEEYVPFVPETVRIKPIGANLEGSTVIPNLVDFEKIDTEDERIPDILPIILGKNFPDSDYFNVSILEAYFKDLEKSKTFVFDSRMISCIKTSSMCYFEECQLAVREEIPEIGNLGQPQLVGSACMEPRQEQKCRLCHNETSCSLTAVTLESCDLPVEFELTNVPACYSKFANVAGEQLIVEAGCTKVDVTEIGHNQSEPSNKYSCTTEDEFNYISRCTCVGHSCNFKEHPDPFVDTIQNTPEKDPIVLEINKSIRQLRADIRRMLDEVVKEKSEL